MTREDSAAVVNGDCEDPVSLTQTIFFRDNGRILEAMINFYPEATAERRRQVYEIRNSLQVAAKN
jgi:hypothetical protein